MCVAAKKKKHYSVEHAAYVPVSCKTSTNGKTPTTLQRLPQKIQEHVYQWIRKPLLLRQELAAAAAAAAAAAKLLPTKKKALSQQVDTWQRASEDTSAIADCWHQMPHNTTRTWCRKQLVLVCTQNITQDTIPPNTGVTIHSNNRRNGRVVEHDLKARRRYWRKFILRLTNLLKPFKG